MREKCIKCARMCVCVCVRNLYLIYVLVLIHELNRLREANRITYI